MTSGFRRTEAGLIGAAFLAPFSATQLPGPLTVGRLAVLFFTALLAADLLRERPWSFRPDPAAVMLVAAYVGLVGWIFVSSATLGCNCDGKAGGHYEFAAIGVLAIVAIGLEPKLRGVAAVAALAGISFAALLALAGVGSINSGTVDLTQTGGRLSGTFGNANELGFAAALGLPLALAYLSVRDRWARAGAAAAALVLVLVLVLTFSRGAIIAAAVGTLALALWQARGSRRRVGLILAAAAVAVVIGGALYAVFERERQDVSFTAVPTTLRPLDQRDVSGWDSRALGPIPNGPSALANGEAGIVVGAGRPGEGAGFRWGEAERDTSYTLRFRARSRQPGLAIEYALADSVQGAGGALGDGRLRPEWRRFSLAWRPPRSSTQATLYIWRPRGRAAFAVDDVSVLARAQGARARAIAVPSQLEGSLYDHLTSSAEREEERYIESRLDAAELAWSAFREEPLLGIGWSTFPDYSAERADYGELAAHNEYLAFAAELGLIGLALLGLAIAAVVLGARRSGPTRAEAAAIGVLAATAAGLVFVEALPAPQLSITIALAAAIVCARRDTRRSGADPRQS